jgi:hypothetical protein
MILSLEIIIFIVQIWLSLPFYNKISTIFLIAQFWKNTLDGENSKYLNWHKFILILCGWWIKKEEELNMNKCFLLTLVQLT